MTRRAACVFCGTHRGSCGASSASPQPLGDRYDEATDTAGRGRELSFERPLEFQHRFVVEGDEVRLGGTESRRVQAVRDGVSREPGIVLLPREPLFVSGGDDIAIDDDRGQRYRGRRRRYREYSRQAPRRGTIGACRFAILARSRSARLAMTWSVACAFR